MIKINYVLKKFIKKRLDVFNMYLMEEQDQLQKDIISGKTNDLSFELGRMYELKKIKFQLNEYFGDFLEGD